MGGRIACRYCVGFVVICSAILKLTTLRGIDHDTFLWAVAGSSAGVAVICALEAICGLLFMVGHFVRVIAVLLVAGSIGSVSYVYLGGGGVERECGCLGGVTQYVFFFQSTYARVFFYGLFCAAVLVGAGKVTCISSSRVQGGERAS